MGGINVPGRRHGSAVFLARNDPGDGHSIAMGLQLDDPLEIIDPPFHYRKLDESRFDKRPLAAWHYVIVIRRLAEKPD